MVLHCFQMEMKVHKAGWTVAASGLILSEDFIKSWI